MRREGKSALLAELVLDRLRLIDIGTPAMLVFGNDGLPHDDSLRALAVQRRLDGRRAVDHHLVGGWSLAVHHSNHDGRDRAQYRHDGEREAGEETARRAVWRETCRQLLANGLAARVVDVHKHANDDPRHNRALDVELHHVAERALARRVPHPQAGNHKAEEDSQRPDDGQPLRPAHARQNVGVSRRRRVRAEGTVIVRPICRLREGRAVQCA